MAIFFFFLEAGNKVSFRDFHNLNCTFKMRENVCTCVEREKQKGRREEGRVGREVGHKRTREGKNENSRFLWALSLKLSCLQDNVLLSTAHIWFTVAYVHEGQSSTVLPCPLFRCIKGKPAEST